MARGVVGDSSAMEWCDGVACLGPGVGWTTGSPNFRRQVQRGHRHTGFKSTDVTVGTVPLGVPLASSDCDTCDVGA
jgi:hypothetical protein